MKNIISAVVLVCCSTLTLAQQPESAGPATDNVAAQESRLPQQVLEEITVRGDSSIISIRNQLERAEDNMYALFNDLNSNDDFDIICRERKRLSHIAKRECEPRFLTRARQANAVTAMAGIREGTASAGGFVGTSGDFSAANGSPMFQSGLDLLESESQLMDGQKSRFEELQTEMLRIASENPDYLEALMRVGKLKQTLTDKRIARFGIP